MFRRSTWLKRVARRADTSTLPTIPNPPWLRLAEPQDFEQIIEVAKNAFQTDPAFLYFVGVEAHEVTMNGLSIDKDRQLRNLMEAFLKTTLSLKGRITVVIDPAQGDKVVATALWLPPNKRIELHHLRFSRLDGASSFLRDCQGLSNMLRARNDWLNSANKAISMTYKARLVKRPVDDSWYLLALAIEPKNQHRGFMRLLMDDAFAHAPNDTFTLAATTEHSKKLFVRFGFEVLSPYRLGRGRVSSDGLRDENTDLRAGVECFAMIKWAPGLTLLE